MVSLKFLPFFFKEEEVMNLETFIFNPLNLKYKYSMLIKKLLNGKETEKDFISFYDEIKTFIEEIMEITDETKDVVKDKLKSYIELLDDFNSIKYFVKIIGFFANIRPNKRKHVPELYFAIIDSQPQMKEQIINFIMETVDMNIIYSLCYDISNLPLFFKRTPDNKLYFFIESEFYEGYRMDAIPANLDYAFDEALRHNSYYSLETNADLNQKTVKKLFVRIKNCTDDNYQSIRKFIFQRDLYDVRKKHCFRKKDLFALFDDSSFKDEFITYFEKGFPNNNYFYEEFQFAKYDKNDFGYYIMYDDVDRFVSLLNYYDIDDLNDFQIEFKDGIEFFNRYSSNEIREYINLIDCSAFYGSVQIFKYLLMNGVLSSSRNHTRTNHDISTLAIAGGNYEIIRLLVQKNIEFNDCYELSTIYHHNELSEWIKLNFKNSYKDIEVKSKYVMNYNNFYLKKAIIFKAIIEKYQDIVVHFINITINLSIEDIVEFYITAAKYNLLRVLKFIDKTTNWSKDLTLEEQKQIFNQLFINNYIDMNLDTYLYIIRKHRINVMDYIFEDNTTFLHLTASCDFEIFKTFIIYFRDLNIQDVYLNTPLFYAVSSGIEENVRLLLDHHADPNIKNRMGQTCRDYAHDKNILNLL